MHNHIITLIVKENFLLFLLLSWYINTRVEQNASFAKLSNNI